MKLLKILLVVIALVISGGGSSFAQTSVEGNVLTSDGFPPVTITFDDSISFVGSEKFVLYGVADTEIFLFASIEGNQVQRLYWIQFEGYLPHVDHKYDYSGSQGRTVINGHMYYEDSWVWNLETAEIKSDSDTQHVLTLLEEAGLKLVPDLLGLRLVRLDATARNELMIVYLQDFSEYSDVSAEFDDEKWAEIDSQLRESALAGFRVSE